MTREEVRSMREEIQYNLDVAKHSAESLERRLRLLQKDCTHPIKFTIMHSGSLMDVCPDCGWSD